ncbi:MAG: hypothetical protein CMM84_17955 [Rhodothermaceae bacterium]|nr:hypothetical protein [Rhodothermaceae bacterium]
MQKDTPVVMVSSTMRDLPKHREEVRDACLRIGMFPKMMEHLPAMDADAIAASLAMVDEADVYVGVFAHRYGYVPDGHDLSITEMEYRRAVERGIPRLIFLMHKDAPLSLDDIDFENKAKLDALKEELKAERVVEFFKSPEELRGDMVHALETEQKKMDAVRAGDATEPTAKAVAASLHHVSDIPTLPEPYVAHPYTLLQVRKFVGRSAEMEMLTDWVTGRRLGHVRVFNVVAIGGMGKSALTWTWFHEVAPQEMEPLAGRLWWSFYESDATYEAFVTRALAYASGRARTEVEALKLSEREDQLLAILDREPFLIVLDGLERILTAYAGMDAAFRKDDDIDEETANRVAGAYGLPESAGTSFVGKHKLRMAADPRAGRFLQRLAHVHASRVLVSTRLYPADLQARTGGPLPGCFPQFLPGLSDSDALALWRAYGAKGSREEMVPVFKTFENHPLLIQLLAAEVVESRESRGDFGRWRAANPDFNAFGLPLVQVQSHVLLHAMRGLSAAELKALQTIAGFRMPASLDTLKALLIRSDADDASTPFASIAEFDAALTVLEDRGLLGWDRNADRYDLHPIVRGVVWAGLDDHTRTDVYGTLRTHFEAMPMVEDWQEVERLADLTPAIELYDKLIGLGLYDEAIEVFYDRLDGATLWRLSASRLRVDLLEKLFPDGPDGPPRLRRARAQSFTLNALALGHQFSGQPGAAAFRFRLANEIYAREEDQAGRSVGLCNLSGALRLSGPLSVAEASALEALILTRKREDRFQEGVSLYWIGLAQASRGVPDESTTALRRSLRIWQAQNDQQGVGMVSAYLAEVALWQDDDATAIPLADRAWALASVQRLAADFIRAARLQGTAALSLGDLLMAGERLHHALQRARAISHVEEELPTLVALAEWHRQRGEPKEARERLDDVWDPAETGPYPLFHADALNVLAQIEHDAGNAAAAVEAATEAYRKAWCDGPPFAYHRGLETAKAHLAVLGAPEPEMPPFDASAHEPMPEVEINPKDAFWVDPSEGLESLLGE